MFMINKTTVSTPEDTKMVLLKLKQFLEQLPDRNYMSDSWWDGEEPSVNSLNSRACAGAWLTLFIDGLNTIKPHPDISFGNVQFNSKHGIQAIAESLPGMSVDEVFHIFGNGNATKTDVINKIGDKFPAEGN